MRKKVFAVCMLASLVGHAANASTTECRPAETASYSWAFFQSNQDSVQNGERQVRRIVETSAVFGGTMGDDICDIVPTPSDIATVTLTLEVEGTPETSGASFGGLVDLLFAASGGGGNVQAIVSDITPSDTDSDGFSQPIADGGSFTVLGTTMSFFSGDAAFTRAVSLAFDAPDGEARIWREVEIHPIPVPAAASLLVSAIWTLAMFRRRRS